MPSGYWTTWGGTFEQLQSAAQRLQLVIPLALLLVFVLLFAMFGNLKDGLLVFTGIPFALTGGVLALWGTLDEIHQAFIPGRSMEAGDALMDAVAGFLGALAATRWGRRAGRITS